MAARHHVHTAVFHVSIFQSQPRAHEVRRLDDGPIGMVLMPDGGSAFERRLVLHLIMPHTHGVGVHQVCHRLRQPGMEQIAVEFVVRLPGVHNLDNNVFLVAIQVAHRLGLLFGLALQKSVKPFAKSPNLLRCQQRSRGQVPVLAEKLHVAGSQHRQKHPPVQDFTTILPC